MKPVRSLVSLTLLCLCIALLSCARGIVGDPSSPPQVSSPNTSPPASGQSPPPAPTPPPDPTPPPAPPPPPGSTVGVTVSPTSATLAIGQTFQFVASVSNATNTNVTWLVNDVAGGYATMGTISASGLYSAPNAVPSGAITVSAISAADETKSATAVVTVQRYTGILSYQNNTGITGQNLSETILTPANVNSKLFGKLYSYALDDQSFAQPLYVANVQFPGAGQHNAVYVCTASNTVYAFDADGKAKAPLWQQNLTPPGASPVDGTTTGYTGGPILPNVGITGTPVIDGASGTLYVVAVTQESSGVVHRLHALDITTGKEKFSGPVVIHASVRGTGSGSVNGNIAFNPQFELQRDALTLVNGVVYMAWGSYDDYGPYHGWIMGYDASTLAQVIAWNSTPNGEQGGIWNAGASFASDSSGNIYVVTGNGTSDAFSGGKNYGDTVLKLKRNGNTFTVSDYFTPFDQSLLMANNLDLGSSGLTLLLNQPGPISNLAVSAGKSGKIYLLDLGNLGGFQAGNDNQIVQSIPNALGTQATDNDFSTATYWQGNVYYIGNNDVIKQFKLNNGLLSSSPVAQGHYVYGYPGANMSVSANGGNNGIVWAIEPGGVNVLHAYDATNVSHELYNSSQAPGRDQFGVAIRFTVPTVINGKVYVAGGSELAIFGPL
jgi:hypothetical protein